MGQDEADAAFDLGRALAAEEIERGADVLIAGDMGIGNTTPAATVIGVITSATATAVTGRGTGIDEATLARKTATVAAAMQRAPGPEGDPVALLLAVGSPDLAAMTAFLLESARLGVPVVLDGIVSCAAALVADRMDGTARAWCCLLYTSPSPRD